jgi:chorismate mutase-like protein
MASVDGSPAMYSRALRCEAAPLHGNAPMNTLEECRREIDVLDEALLSMLARRFRFCAIIAAYKCDRGIPMLQPARAAAVLMRVRGVACDYGISADFAEALFAQIMAESCRLGEQIIAGSCPAEAPLDSW